MKFYLDIPITFPGNIQKTFDLIVPDGDPKHIPLLLWIHGGGWSGGEKRVYNDFERFTNRGYAVLSIDYRLSHEAPFPAHLIDCKMAVRWARAKASEYGYNPDRILVGGSSAGGHLAALLGVTNGKKEYDQGDYIQFSSDVQAVVDKYGPTDLTVDGMPNLASDLRAFLLDDPEKIHAASPLRHITGQEPPYLIMHGTEDPLVPVTQSRDFVQALHQAGVHVQYLEVPGAGHGFDTAEEYALLTQFVLEQLPKEA